MPPSLEIHTCCHDSSGDYYFTMMSSAEKDGLNVDNNYKSCFARSVVVNSQFGKQGKSQELFLGDLLEPLKMVVENDQSVTTVQDAQFEGRKLFCKTVRVIKGFCYYTELTLT